MKDQIKDVNKNAFNNPYTQFYACNTGTGNYSFAQAWVDRVGGKALAAVPNTGETSAKTDYAKITDGQPFNHRTSRFFNGFSLFGSVNLPVANSTGTFKMFYPR